MVRFDENLRTWKYLFYRISMRKNESFCGILEGNEKEEFYIVHDCSKNTNLYIIGRDAYERKEVPLYSYQSHQETPKHFVRHGRSLYATGDQKGVIMTQFGDVR